MKILLSFVLLLFCSYSFSQSCDGFYYFKNNKKVEVTITNKKGKITGKNVYTVSDVKKSGATVTANVNSELLDDEGKSIAKSTSTMKCISGVVMVDMKMFLGPAQQQQLGSASASSEAYLGYPANMKVGDALEDGQFNSDIKMQSGINAHLEVEIKNRKIEGKESVTTPAGTWDCFKITYHSKVVVKIGIGIPINANVTEWYAPGFGVVKTEANGAKTEVTSIQ